MTTVKATIAPRTGLTLQSPVLAAAGTFGYGVEYAARNSLAGLGAVICKGTTSEPRAGNEPLRVCETSAGMLNAIGLQNIGIEALVRDKAPIWASWATPVLVNVSGTSIEDYVSIVSRLQGVVGVSGVELNISCPNVMEGGVAFGNQPEMAHDVTAAVRRSTDLPLVVKLSPNVVDIESIALAVEAAGADAVSLINTVYGMAIDVDRRAPTLSNVSGGLSGPAIKPLALHLVYQVARSISVPTIGIGGIMTTADALEFILAGATAIQVGTALLVDPHGWRKIVDGINAWCDREGIRNLDEIRGAANPGYKGVKNESGGQLPATMSGNMVEMGANRTPRPER